MAKFNCQIIETRRVSCTYTVQADSLNEAIQKAEIGDTVKESDDRIVAITDRDVRQVEDIKESM